MKKWLLILLILFIIVVTFGFFALQFDFGGSIGERIRDIWINNVPQPPGLPD
jgi:hypothetical protein